MKDAKSLVSLDNGERLDYFDTVRTMWASESNDPRLHKTVGNWYVFHNSAPLLALDPLTFRVLHELGGLLNTANIPFSPTIVPPASMVSILQNLHEERITGSTAKRLLAMIFDGDNRDVNAIIEQDHLSLQRLSRDEYIAMAQALLDEEPKKVEQIRRGKQIGKLKFFVGQMMRRGSGRVEAQKAEGVLKGLLDLE